MAEPLWVEGLRELDAAVAEKIFGFTRRTADGSLYYLHPSRGWGSLPDNEPAPSGALRCGDWDRYVAHYSASAWWKVVKRMDTLGFHAVIKTPFEPNGDHSAGFTPHGITGWNGRPDHAAEAKLVGVAVALAALRAVGVEVELAEDGSRLRAGKERRD